MPPRPAPPIWHLGGWKGAAEACETLNGYEHHSCDVLRSKLLPIFGDDARTPVGLQRFLPPMLRIAPFEMDYSGLLWWLLLVRVASLRQGPAPPPHDPAAWRLVLHITVGSIIIIAPTIGLTLAFLLMLTGFMDVDFGIFAPVWHQLIKPSTLIHLAVAALVIANPEVGLPFAVLLMLLRQTQPTALNHLDGARQLQLPELPPALRESLREMQLPHRLASRAAALFAPAPGAPANASSGTRNATSSDTSPLLDASDAKAPDAPAQNATWTRDEAAAWDMAAIRILTMLASGPMLLPDEPEPGPKEDPKRHWMRLEELGGHYVRIPFPKSDSLLFAGAKLALLWLLFPLWYVLLGPKLAGQGLLPMFLSAVFWISWLSWKLLTGLWDAALYLALQIIGLIGSIALFLFPLPTGYGAGAGADAMHLAQAPGPPADGQPPRELARRLVAGGGAMRNDAHAALASLRRALTAGVEGARARVPSPTTFGASLAAQVPPLPTLRMPWVDVQWGRRDDAAAA